MDFGTFLLNKRTEVAVSANQLADWIGCSGWYITLIERQERTPSRQMAQEILTALQVDYVIVDDLTLSVREDNFTFNTKHMGRGGEKLENFESKVSVPNFVGRYLIKWVFGGIKDTELIGVTYDSTGRPVYLHDKDGTFYNFNTIISVKEHHV